MSAESSRAVFLSYASQDAGAARRICEALREGGVEVWFDADGGLEHGDEWDAKIRKQIKECVLFIPVISANTQARLEGYFRIEWDLAAERARGIASGVPFILPVAIDETREPEALVPDRFRMVQWTKLPGGVVTPEVKARYLKLWSHRTSVLSHAAAGVASDEGAAPSRARPAGRSLRNWFVGAIALAAVMFAASLLVFQWRRSLLPPSVGAGTRPAAGGQFAPISEAARLAEEARQRYAGVFTRADLAVAAESAHRATDLDSRLARAWAARAGVQSAFLSRHFVFGTEAEPYARDAKTFADRALALGKDDAEALIALGVVAWSQGARNQAEAYFRRAIESEPDNLLAMRQLAQVFRSTNRQRGALTLMKDAARRFPRDAPTRFELGQCYHGGWNFAKAWDEYEAALAVQPYFAPQLALVSLALNWKGDLAQARALLERVDVTSRGESEALRLEIVVSRLERRADRVREAVGHTTGDFLEEFQLPKAFFLAEAFEFEGKPNLARQQLLVAETVLRERLRAEPQSLMLRVRLATTLAQAGRTLEARAELEPIEATLREQGGRAGLLATFYAAAGDAAKAVEVLRQSVNRGAGFAPTTTNDLRLATIYDKIRASPEFQALLANPPPTPQPIDDEPATSGGMASAVKSDEKSVAVLAFDNRSDDKEAEYFSDGISEELINALGRVPGLTVKGRTSAFFFKGKNATAQEIGEKLGVSYLVRGSVRKAGGKVRITAQLSRAATDEVVWSSESLERDLKDVFAVQDEIAGLIAKNLSLKLGASSSPAKTAVNPVAFELYLQGRQQWNFRSAAALAKAEEFFNRALALDAKLIRAHAGLADVALLKGQVGQRIDFYPDRQAPALAAIVAQIEQVLALDPHLAETHTSLGGARLFGWDFAGAERELRQAIALNPNYATAHQWLGRVLTVRGRMDEGLAELKLAADLDPLSSRIVDNYAIALMLAGRLTESLAAIARSLAVSPGAWQATNFKIEILLQLHRDEEALAMVREIGVQDPTYRIGPPPPLLARVGLRREAESVFKKSPDGPNDAGTLLALDRREEALATLTADRVGVLDLDSLLYKPTFDDIRAEPRFVRMIEGIGLTEAHARAQAWRAAHPAEKLGAKK